MRQLMPSEIAAQKRKTTSDRINALYPNASKKEKSAIWEIVQKCRRLKIKHVVDQYID